ncbi:transcription-repair coupling factor [Candidatus Peribacteria bacterium]|jgi:transcription-repair coupling factor (superfamily II helicase)|nr:transcription-repair coupling factor [Candidatus Peribacteria bacterium]MBT4020998.1 transcription-repair coupling factor [Candidatus Peribacteria bacterium]MBT4240897.1 transcription-repair coupling factor [Candidatus Peribacteria bacterium]MBT4474120.1 transcription-repair coupling factor [Candidatus Peribacteria bacterium]
MKPSLLLGEETHRELRELLLAKKKLVISGASNGTAKAMFVAHIFDMSPSKTIVVLPDEGRREEMERWLNFFEVATESIKSSKNEDGNSFSRDDLPSYLSFFKSDYAEVLLITESVWEEEMPLLKEMSERKITFSKGQEIDITNLFERLIEIGYSHGQDIYLKPGEYRKIGDVLDIFPIQAESPIKIQFNFEKIEEIKEVNTEDVSSTEIIEGDLDVYPAKWQETEKLYKQLEEEHMLILDDIESNDSEETNANKLMFSSFPESGENHAHVRYLSVLKFYTLADFLNDVRDKLSQKWKLLIVSKRAEELISILKEENISHTVDEETRPGTMTIVDASQEEVLPHSLQNPDMKLAMLTDREIFSLKKEAKQRSIQKLSLDFITSLQPGDFVVHMDHGIGRFDGIVQKTIDEVTREYLEISYAGNDKLFIPIDQADKLSKHVHEEGEEPKLSKLGSIDWKKTMAKVKEETKKIAKELLALYAKRAKAKGFSYGEDVKEQKEFERAFPYTETPGQLKAIEDIKTDMEDPHPMDRLICGDVGFGKTEVALRAAFKAVKSGKQVAIISPITILADQHYRTVIKRMGDFSVRVEMLSRFRSKAEQKKILEKLRKGDLDIVVGTHRLLQPDVKFLNLGLLIIDEEQRFGVKQKEAIKEMRANVDILTLTATPIPRTLNLSLHKFRDITTITTPPPGRLPIITEVRKYSDALLRQSILNEVNRKGQVYVLHNRVETIDAFADKLRKLIPEASFIVSHGQLRPEDLEKRVSEFKDGKYDVLVSSTIIENGIDLPRANTLIVNEAERFGLSQLYQLRGRVGRGKVQAYAYFLYHTQRLKDDAKKRLRAIVEASELGSGFQIAMRDLEIRGAGEILGGSQSGHMKTVGMSQFLKLLKQTVAEMQTGSKKEKEEIETEINLPIEAYIPNFYIPDEQEKISVYQKLAGSYSEEILKEFEEDLEEEFGTPPKQVGGLFRILRLKMVCRKAGVMRIKMEGGKVGSQEVVVTLHPRVTAKHIVPLLAKNDKWKVVGSSLRIKKDDLGESWFAALKKDMEVLVGKKQKLDK